MSDGLTAYLSGIGRVAALSAEEECELGRQVQAGLAAQATLEDDDGLEGEGGRADLRRLLREGEAARRRLTEANLRLVVYLAKGYQGRGVSFADLVQEGNVGLMAAATRYLPEKGWRFSTYAGSWIRSAMLAAIKNQRGVVRLPSHLSAAATQITRAEQDFEKEHRRVPTLAELSRRCGIPEDQVARVRELRASPVSLSAPFGEDTSLGEMLADGEEAGPDDVVIERLRSAAVREAAEEALAAVDDERVRRLLRLRFGLADGRVRTLAELSGQFGVTKERLRQIEARTLSRLRRSGLGAEVRELIGES
ncbi:MAG: sigma-70 family RNA polymerase sigma factor [bacterium]|nr:sigma-70 family RNA polymerase sigma factor [bacterium]MDE0669208.1 sigma-70 family RNA polymerase sigma factor [bacterium]MXZ30400.1 sigma-70 family RNA polymerase sigma factor [Acidimicrobiia bacterium]MYJ12788.1 sigma-70 family RNA polymerase sigma factor [Acidimicrobiia bacterium]